MLVRRIELTNAEQKKAAAAKRKRAENGEEEKAPRQYEYVDISVLGEALVRHLRSSFIVTEKCRGHEITLFAYCTALLGSDFSAGICPNSP
jgi:hypothetical protein